MENHAISLPERGEIILSWKDFEYLREYMHSYTVRCDIEYILENMVEDWDMPEEFCKDEEVIEECLESFMSNYYNGDCTSDMERLQSFVEDALYSVHEWKA